MSKELVRRSGLFLIVAAILAVTLGVGAQPALANEGTFDVSVYHGINGRSLGLSKELPVDVYIYKDGALLTMINDFSFKDRVDFNGLMAGKYKIEVKSEELGIYLPSMTVGPVDIPGDVVIRMNAQLGEGKTPIIKVKIK